MSREYDKFVDAKGLKCPQPLLLAKHAIKEMQAGDVLLLEATDAGTDLDLEVWCERFGHQIIQQQQKTGVFLFWLRKGIMGI
ncbi:MAG: sulfurtransferase TusA family protein [Proteobacteria bacterium]|nr:sulfurtransferase TusA family protein [Pseudomonadota bacterium]